MGNCFTIRDDKSSENQKHIYEVDTSGENQDIRSSVTSACTSPPRSLREFTFPELWDATTGFSIYNLLGEGGFGPVYKGHIEGLDIAVKRLNAEGCQGHKEWRTEVESLGRLHHPNIVQLIGLCSEQDQHLLIYEYISMGSLEHILMDGGCKLNWERRLRIVTGIAKGLAYLHEQQPPIIHRDLKPSNILLDLNYNAKLCDFGLARDGPTTTRSHVSTRVMGTHAYVDPEYQESGHLKVGCDVYGFGVVLLQILTGQSPMLRAPSGKERSIAEWARPWLRCKDRYKIREIMDPRLYEEYPIESASRVGRIADHCTRDIRWRLRADQIVQFLEQCRS